MTTTLGDLCVGGVAYLRGVEWLFGVTRNAFFAALEAVASAIVFWPCLAVSYLLGFPRLFRDQRRGVRTASVLIGFALGVLEVRVFIPVAMYAWAGHDYETLAQMGWTKFYIGVVFESLAGLTGCLAGSWAVGRLWMRHAAPSDGERPPAA